MKLCSLCLLPRPDAVFVCPVCAHPAGEATSELAPDRSLELIAEQRLAEAYYWLEAEVQAGRESGEFCRRLAWLGLAIQDIRAVETWCHESLRLDGDSGEPHLLLAYVLQREGRWAESIEEWDAALRRTMAPQRRELAEQLRAEAARRLPEW